MVYEYVLLKAETNAFVAQQTDQERLLCGQRW